MPFDKTRSRDGLNDPEIADTLSRLHQEARRDRWVFARALPARVRHHVDPARDLQTRP